VLCIGAQGEGGARPPWIRHWRRRLWFLKVSVFCPWISLEWGFTFQHFAFWHKWHKNFQTRRFCDDIPTAIFFHVGSCPPLLLLLSPLYYNPTARPRPQFSRLNGKQRCWKLKNFILSKRQQHKKTRRVKANKKQNKDTMQTHNKKEI